MGSPTLSTDHRRRAVAGSTLLFDFAPPMPGLSHSESLGLQQRARVLWHARPVIAKRGLDIVLVTPLVLIMLPVWALCALCIKLESPGPVFFRQRRVGQHGQQFTMYKLRSMGRDAEARRQELDARNEMPGGVLFKLRQDPRI